MKQCFVVSLVHAECSLTQLFFVLSDQFGLFLLLFFTFLMFLVKFKCTFCPSVHVINHETLTRSSTGQSFEKV